MAISTIGTNSLSDPIAVNGYTPTASNMQPFNRIINGAMTIDQRNAGASVGTASGSSTYTVDRWYIDYAQTSKFTIQQNAGSVTPPLGFSNYLGVTSSSSYSLLAADYFILSQNIEGFNFSDMNWGTATAQTVTLSFWVRSSLTGAFGGNFQNAAGSRSYPFPYTINAANTWEQKTITIAGDTSGTWIGGTNGVGVKVRFGLGFGSNFVGTANAWAGSYIGYPTGSVSVVGTSGATFYITGVQLEAGSTASPFAHENVGDTLQKCYRYYYYAGVSQGAGYQDGSTNIQATFTTPVPMRATPALTTSGSTYIWRHNGYGNQSSPSNTINNYSGCSLLFTITGYSGGANGYIANWYSVITCSAEL